MTQNKLRVLKSFKEQKNAGHLLYGYVLNSVAIDDSFDADYKLILKEWDMWLSDNGLDNLSYILTEVCNTIKGEVL